MSKHSVRYVCDDQSLVGSLMSIVLFEIQVFHVCQADGRKNDFLCPVGTIFNQEHFVCDWWQNFRCQDTPSFYSNNELLYNTFVNNEPNNNLLQANQLRKRTDSIEREDEGAFSSEGNEGKSAIGPKETPSIEVEDDYVGNEEEEDEHLSKGINRNYETKMGKFVEGKRKEKVVQEDRVSPGIKSTRVTSFFGARLAADVRVSGNKKAGRHDNWAAASSHPHSRVKEAREETYVHPMTHTTTTTAPTTTTQSRKVTLITVTPRNTTTTSPIETVKRYNLIQMMTSSLPIPV